MSPRRCIKGPQKEFCLRLAFGEAPGIDFGASGDRFWTLQGSIWDDFGSIFEVAWVDVLLSSLRVFPCCCSCSAWALSPVGLRLATWNTGNVRDDPCHFLEIPSTFRPKGCAGNAPSLNRRRARAAREQGTTRSFRLAVSRLGMRSQLSLCCSSGCWRSCSCISRPLSPLGLRLSCLTLSSFSRFPLHDSQVF